MTDTVQHIALGRVFHVEATEHTKAMTICIINIEHDYEYGTLITLLRVCDDKPDKFRIGPYMLKLWLDSGDWTVVENEGEQRR